MMLHHVILFYQAKTLLSDPEALAALMAANTQTSASDDKQEEKQEETKKEESDEESDDDMGFGKTSPSTSIPLYLLHSHACFLFHRIV